MRLFFGLELAPQTALAIAAWRDRQLPLAGRPVPAQNFHITLAFLGEVRERGLERLCQMADEICAGGAPHAGELRLDEVGYWPRPGIYWLGPRHWPVELDTLADRLRGLSRQAGGKRDRNRFHPHVTLFRGCDVPPSAPTTEPHFELHYRGFTLFESRQGRKGVLYSPLGHWNL